MISPLVKCSLTLCAAVLVASLSSCSKLPFKKDPVAIAPVQAPVAQWYQVSQSPPTYFPRGLSKNAPTTAYHGFWVNGGDASLWFVPKNGVQGFTAAELQKTILMKQKTADKVENRKVLSQKKNAVSKTLQSSKKKVFSAFKAGYSKVKNPF